MTALRQRSNTRWLFSKDGRPPDDDENTYQWDRRAHRWVALDEPEVNEDALEDWQERRRQRLAEANEY